MPGDDTRVSLKVCRRYLLLIYWEYLVFPQIITSINKLVEDDNEHVRAALASCISGLSPLVGKEQTIDKLLNIFLKLFRDEHAEVNVEQNFIIIILRAFFILGPSYFSKGPTWSDIKTGRRESGRMMISNMKIIFNRGNRSLVFMCRQYFSSEQVVGIDLLSQSLLPSLVELAEDKQVLRF